MKDAGIIHCDLKPENILLCADVGVAEIKIIDLGSACMESRTVYSYIQSRHYSSPEVLLGYQYTTAIDMWSFGCTAAELFLGIPLFPGASAFDLLRRMIEILGGQPPDYILRKAECTSKFFKCTRSISHDDQNSRNNCSMYQVLIEEEFTDRESEKPSIEEYYNHMNLEAIVTKWPYMTHLSEEDIAKECQMRPASLDFLRGLLEFDPEKRWMPLQALKHPFLTGEPFTCPYKPAPETPRVPVYRHVIMVDHNPAGGDWFVAGLSPNISGCNRRLLPHSPHYQKLAYGHPGCYGSLGSNGNYNDGIGSGTSFGNYDDNSNFNAFYSPAVPSGMSLYAQNGSPLGEIAAGSYYNRRKNKGYFGNVQSQESSSSSSWQGRAININTCSQSEGSSSPSHRWLNSSALAWRPRQGRRSGPHSSSHSGESSSTLAIKQGSGYDKPGARNLVPDPGDWDPGYSEEQLLQEDSSDMRSMAREFINGMHLNQRDEWLVGIGRSNHNLNTNAALQRHDEPDRSLSFGNHVAQQSRFVPHLAESSSSRLGQQSAQHHNPGRSAPFHGRAGDTHFSDNSSHGRNA